MSIAQKGAVCCYSSSLSLSAATTLVSEKGKPGTEQLQSLEKAQGWLCSVWNADSKEWRTMLTLLAPETILNIVHKGHPQSRGISLLVIWQEWCHLPGVTLTVGVQTLEAIQTRSWWKDFYIHKTVLSAGVILQPWPSASCPLPFLGHFYFELSAWLGQDNDVTEAYPGTHWPGMGS